MREFCENFEMLIVVEVDFVRILRIILCAVCFEVFVAMICNGFVGFYLVCGFCASLSYLRFGTNRSVSKKCKFTRSAFWIFRFLQKLNMTNIH